MNYIYLLIFVALSICNNNSLSACKKISFWHHSHHSHNIHYLEYLEEKMMNDFYDSMLQEEEEPNNFATQCEEKKYSHHKTVSQQKDKTSVPEKQNRRLAALLRHINPKN